MMTALLRALISIALLCNGLAIQAQESPEGIDRVLHLPDKFFQKLQSKAKRLDESLSRQTEKYLRRLQRKEKRIQRRMDKLDSAGSRQLFAHSTEKYEQLSQRLEHPAAVTDRLGGDYLPYLDSLKGSLSFLDKHANMLSGPSAQKAKQALSTLEQYQAKLKETESIKAFIRQRKQEIKEQLSQYTHLPKNISKGLQDFNKDAYYYSQQLREYRQVWSHPEKLEQRALSVLNKLPVFQQFMKEHSELAGLFRLPGNYGSAQALQGLQTRSQVQQLIQGQVASGGPNARQMLQQNLQAAQSQLNQLKNRLNQLGAGGSGDMDMPDFRPRNEKTKTFFQRLEYGTNIQSAKSSYFFPTTTDIGLSVGYKLREGCVIGIGASYKIGLGKDIRHVRFSSEGAGLRSFVDYKLKGSFYASGGLEYNYQQPFQSLGQVSELRNWQQSGLVGISKVVSLKSKLFKKTKLQILWDFLSYRQIPRTQPVRFRVGYALK